jgi:choline/glycine/proline betaine transport protein
MNENEAGASTGAEPSSRIKPVVFYGSAALTLVVALWAIVAPTAAADTIGALVGWISEWFGWFYILLSTAILVFVIFVGASRYGRTRLGPEHSRPRVQHVRVGVDALRGRHRHRPDVLRGRRAGHAVPHPTPR